MSGRQRVLVRLRVLISRIRCWIKPGGLDEEFQEELQSHLDLLTEENINRGMPPEEARRAARVRLGGLTQLRETNREANGLPRLDAFVQDVRYAGRMIRKNPGFASVAVLVFALGICAAVSIFAFVDAALIKPLPYRDPSRLVGVYEKVGLIPRSNLSYLDYLDWKEANTVFSSFDVWNGTGYLLGTPDGVEPVPAVRVTDGFFRTLGVPPLLGRDFQPGEDDPGAPATLLLSYDAWRNRFGGKENVVGQVLTLGGDPYTVIGVLPPEFHFAPRGNAELWTTLREPRPCERRRSCHNLYGVARLRDGVSVQAALEEMTSIAARLEEQYPDSNRGQGASVAPLGETIVGKIRPVLLVLLGGAGLLLLIACVNVSSLLLARSESRKREIAVRGALGASPGRLIRQFVTEGLVLVSLGCVLGLLSGRLLMQLLAKLIPADQLSAMPYLQGLGINFRVALFALLISLMATALFALAPSFRSGSRITDGLTEGGRGSAGTTWRRFGSKLVVVELAIATVLLVGAGLLGKSFYHLIHAEIGFESDQLATTLVAPPAAKYGTDEQAVALARRIVETLSKLPGVESVALSSSLPLSGNGNTTWFRIVGRPYDGEHNEVNQRDVSAGFFTTLKAKLWRGRFFTDDEDSSKPRVVVINRALAEQYFPGEDPLGQRIGNTSLSEESIMEIVGIVDNIQEGSLGEEIWPAIYVPFNQSPDSFVDLIVRTRQPEAILPTLGEAIHTIDPDIGTIGETTVNAKISNSQTAYLHRSSAFLVGGFASLALLLGVIGLYGVIAYSVSQRTREIGVRMALGAGRSSLYQMVLGEAARLAAAGIGLGLVGALASAGLLDRLLFGVQSWDVPTLASVSLALALAALLASYVPARRAMKVDPIVALRHE